MVQVTFDTNNDSLAELEESLKILQAAVERKRAAKMDMPEQPAEPEEEAAIDTPFFKITVKSDDDHEEKRPAAKPHAAEPAKPAPKAPTLNQLLHDESLTEDELSKMFSEQLEQEAKKPKKSPEKAKPAEESADEKQDAYIEIIEYSEEK